MGQTCNCCQDTPKTKKIQQLVLITETSINEPNENVAKPICKLPILSQKAKERIQQLGDYLYDADIVGQKLQPFLFNNGVIYDGCWKNGKMHGYGKYYFQNGIMIETTTNNGQIKGKGRIITKNGDYYIGEIKDNQANGLGQCSYNGIYYKGKFQNNQPHGKGQQVGPQYTFQGMFQQGKKIRGIMKFGKNLSCQYTGQLKDNKPYGVGKMVNNIGIYQGQFVYGKKHGKGQFAWKNGHTYVGTYENDKKSGFGILKNAKGETVFQGYWLNDKPIE